MTKSGEAMLESGAHQSHQTATQGGASSSGSASQARMASIAGGNIDKNFKNRKVVAWLTNRPIEEEKYEREQFFKMLN